MFRIGSAHQRYVYTWHTQCKAEGDSPRMLGLTCEKIVVEHLETLPVLLIDWVCWFLPGAPGSIRHRTLRDDPHTSFPGPGNGMIDGLLIRNIHRNLQDIKGSTGHGVEGSPAITAIANITGLASITRSLQHLDDLTLAQKIPRTAMELYEVKMICPESLQTALYIMLEQSGAPIRQIKPCRMAAFGEKVVVTATIPDCLSNQFFASPIAFCGINDVHPGIKRLSK